jgi:hypothetical protein
MIREFLMLVIESSYGTPKTSPTSGTERIYIRLDGDNSFTMQANPAQVPIARGGGFAVDALHYAGQTEVTGTLRTKLYASQSAFLWKWMSRRVQSGQTDPWTTTEPVGDLASMSVYHAYANQTNTTYKRTRYAGCKVTSWTLSASDRDPYWTLEAQLQAQKPVGNAQDSSSDPDATEFPTVADTNLPTDPYLWRHTAFSLGGTSRTEIKSFSLSSQHVLDPQFYASRWLSVLPFFGRTTTYDAEIRLKTSPDDRASYEALTNLAAELVLADGSVTTTFDLQDTNKLTQLTRNLPIGGINTWRLQGKCLWDATAGADIAIAVT